MLNWQNELPESEGLFINSDWTDNPTVSIVSNDPEVGNPIRRLRSYNIKHTLSCSMTVDREQFNKFSNFVLRKLHGGIDPFVFKSFLDGYDYTAALKVDNGAPFTCKRQDAYQFNVRFTIVYIELGGATNA